MKIIRLAMDICPYYFAICKGEKNCDSVVSINIHCVSQVQHNIFEKPVQWIRRHPQSRMPWSTVLAEVLGVLEDLHKVTERERIWWRCFQIVKDGSRNLRVMQTYNMDNLNKATLTDNGVAVFLVNWRDLMANVIILQSKYSILVKLGFYFFFLSSFFPLSVFPFYPASFPSSLPSFLSS